MTPNLSWGLLAFCTIKLLVRDLVFILFLRLSISLVFLPYYWTVHRALSYELVFFQTLALLCNLSRQLIIGTSSINSLP